MADRWVKIKKSQLEVLCRLSKWYIQDNIIGGAIDKDSMMTASHYVRVNEAKLQLNDKRRK